MPDLTRLRAALAKSAPSEWKVSEDYNRPKSGRCLIHEGGTPVANIWGDYPETYADLIAAAVNSLPALLDVVEAAKRVGGVQEWRDRASASPHITVEATNDIVRLADALDRLEAS